MLVYGDAEHTADCAGVRLRITHAMEDVIAHAPGRARHERMTEAFLTTAELVQGMVDRAFAVYGHDDVSPAAEAGSHLLRAQARALLTSWRSGFSAPIMFPAKWKYWLARLDSPEPVRIKVPEGYAFYAVCPEMYLEAARMSGLGPRTVVIGLRSIGTSLAALVAAALGAGPAFTLRPAGHPFAREVRVSASLAARVLADPEADFAIVDEGPGLSGSSFGCVADWLEARGVARERIHFFPSHDGDLGPQASARHRGRWHTRPRHVISMDAVLGERLKDAAAEVTGDTLTGWTDISGGRWRVLSRTDDAAWPPCDTQMEKRKFLMRGEQGSWLVKFSGLGELTQSKLRRAARLSEAGFTPPVAGSCHGFLVQEWIEGQLLSSAARDRSRLIGHLGRYLAFRGRMPAPPGGASLDDLCAMASHNTKAATGLDATSLLKHLTRRSFHLRPIDSDNRMHIWEWLVSPDGRLLKTDALDHNAAHDLIGSQDIAWDLAGACVEFDLTARDRDDLLDQAASHGAAVPDPDVLQAFELFYLAFQTGLWTFATQSSGNDEASRIRLHLARYTERLCALLIPDYAMAGGGSAA